MTVTTTDAVRTAHIRNDPPRALLPLSINVGQTGNPLEVRALFVLRFVFLPRRVPAKPLSCVSKNRAFVCSSNDRTNQGKNAIAEQSRVEWSSVDEGLA